MRPVLVCLIAVTFMVGCGCHDTSLRGDPDSSVDPREDDLVEDSAADEAVEPTDPCEGVTGPVMIQPAVRITDSEDPSRWASLSWTGSGYALVWMTWVQEDPDSYPSDGSVYLARLDPEGARTAEDRLVARNAYIGHGMDIAWNGSRLALLWDGTVEFHSLQLSVFDASGDLVPEESLHDFMPPGYGTLVWTGDQYGIAATGPRGITFIVSDGHGGIVRDVIVLRDEWMMGIPPGLAWDGTDYVVSWIGNLPDPPGRSFGDLYFSRISTSMEPVGADTVLTSGEDAYGPSVTWTGSEFGLVWDRDSHGLTFSRVASDGTMLSDSSLLMEGTGYNPFRNLIEWTGRGFGVIRGCCFFALDDSGEVIGETLGVCSESAITLGSDLAWTGSEFGLAWSETRGEADECLDEDNHIICATDVFFTRIVICE